MNRAIIDFYIYDLPDERGYTLADYLHKDNKFWGRDIKMYEWLFPNENSARKNSCVTVLDPETIAELSSSEVFRETFKDVLYRFTVFLYETDWYNTNYDMLLYIGYAIRSARLLGFEEVAKIWCHKYSDVVRRYIGYDEPCLVVWRKWAGLA